VNTSSSVAVALAAWRHLLGEQAVLSSTDAERIYGSCTTGDARALAGALKPTRKEEIQAIVQIAVQYGVSLYTISTGHNWGYGCALPVVDDCVILDLSSLTAITDFDPDLGVVTVGPGVTQAALAQFLAQSGDRFLVPVTGAGPNASILGNALERGYGITPIADHFLAVQSVEAVLADGRIYQPALAELGPGRLDRFFKWGIGPHLDGMFTQSNLGIVTSMTIALARRAESMQAFFLTLRSAEELEVAVECVRRMLQALPGMIGGVNVMNRERVTALMAQKAGRRHERTGGQVFRRAADAGSPPWTLFGTLYGTRESVGAAKQVIRKLVRPLAGRPRFVSPAMAGRLRQLAGKLPRRVRARIGERASLLEASLQLVAGRPNEAALRVAYSTFDERERTSEPRDPSRDGCGLIWYTPLVVMKGEIVSRYVRLCTALLTEFGLPPLITLTSISDRCFDSSVPLLFDRNDPDAVDRARTCYRRLLERGASEGFVPYRLGIGAMDWLQGHEPVALQIVSQIKQVLDPTGVLSPGRYCPQSAQGQPAAAADRR
jgi:FAD/FMN-containing dehydrogenase